MFRSIPGSPGHPGRSAEGAIPQEITSEGLAATRPELGDGGAVPAPAPQAGGSPPIASLLPPHFPSHLAAARFLVTWPGPHPFSVPLLRSLTLGTRCPVRLADAGPVPPDPCRGPRLFSWGTLRRG